MYREKEIDRKKKYQKAAAAIKKENINKFLNSYYIFFYFIFNFNL